MIAGTIIISSMLLTISIANKEASVAGLEWLGYLIMMLALSMIFVGIKRYRDQHLGGIIKFGTATMLGLGITLVASIIYVIVWEINLSITDYAFIDQYTTSVIADSREAGIEGAEMDKLIVQMDTMKEQYGNPLFRIPMTFLEIFPVGLIISLISAAILRNSKVLPAKQLSGA